MDLCKTWRPKEFSQVLGQEGVISSLRALIDKDHRLPSCLLFVGPSGVGKTTLARICCSYVGIPEFNIQELNASDKNGADDCREITENMQYSAFGSSKVVIADECQKFSSNAWSILLKPLEEPVANTWILCTTETHKIPKAIMTRCTKYELKPVNGSLLLKFLKEVVEKEQFTVPKAILTNIILQSEGSVRQALKSLELVHNETDLKKAQELLKTGPVDENSTAFQFAQLIAYHEPSWEEAIASLQTCTEEAESIRLVTVACLNKAILGSTKNMKRTEYLLRLLDGFMRPINPSEKIASILLAMAGTLLPD